MMTDAELSKALEVEAERDQLRIEVERLRLQKRPVAWRVKDYADQWMLFHTEEAACRLAEATGAVMQGLYVRDGTVTQPSYRVTEQNGWFYVFGPASDSGPWRYRWEAQEYADELNAKAA